MLRAVLAAIVFTLAAAAVSAQDYPARPVRVLVPFPAGSGIDSMLRVMLDELRKQTSAVFIVENRPGALGQIATEAAARAAPDGYTMMIASSATHSSGPQLVRRVPYDVLKDFTHIVRVNTFDIALVVNPAQGFKTLAELIGAARAKPDDLTFGYGSATAQVAAATFTRAAGMAVRGVPYKGQPPALTDLLGGQVNFVMADLAVILPQVRSGKLVALALAAERRSSILPNVPTFAELGVKDVELVGWTGISGPAQLPRDVVTWWSTQVNAALGKKEFAERFRAIAVEGDPNTVEQFNQYVPRQFEIWGRRIREAGIQPE